MKMEHDKKQQLFEFINFIHSIQSFVIWLKAAA